MLIFDEEKRATGSDSITVNIDGRGSYLECVFGHKHRGEYAVEDVLMCECPHGEPLLKLEEPEQAMCGACGRVFNLEAIPEDA